MSSAFYDSYEGNDFTGIAPGLEYEGGNMSLDYTTEGGAISDDVYTGVAWYGRFRLLVGTIIALIFALILWVLGYAELKDKHTSSVNALVTKVSTCTQMQPPNQAPYFICTVDVSYSADGKALTKQAVAVQSPSQLVVGSTVLLRYNPNDPTDILQEESPKLLGYGLIITGILIAAISVGITYAAFKSKAVAATLGTVDLVSDAYGAIRR